MARRYWSEAAKKKLRKLYGTPGYVGTVAGITVHADPEIPEHTVVIRDELGRELGRIVNVGK